MLQFNSNGLSVKHKRDLERKEDDCQNQTYYSSRNMHMPNHRELYLQNNYVKQCCILQTNHKQRYEPPNELQRLPMVASERPFHPMLIAFRKSARVT
jgi:hypothetical protein